MSKIKQVDYKNVNWGPFVMRTKAPKYIIKKLLSEGKKAKKNFNYSLAGHLNHQYLYPIEIQNWFYKEITPIINAYREGHCKFHGLENLTVELDFDDLWINFMEAGDFNPLHTHGGDYSFVLFLDIPKELKKEQNAFEGTSARPGSLTFEYGIANRPRWATTGKSVEPEVGDLYMFPALMQHWVAPFKSKIVRVSVSGNLRIVNRDKLPHDYF